MLLIVSLLLPKDPGAGWVPSKDANERMALWSENGIKQDHFKIKQLHISPSNTLLYKQVRFSTSNHSNTKILHTWVFQVVVVVVLVVLVVLIVVVVV